MIDILGFIKNNPNKLMTIQVWCYEAKFRFLIKFIPPKYLKKSFGIEGEESEGELTYEEYKYARRVSQYVNRSADNTPWESKCLVRALTAQSFLKRKKIPSTLYLGVGKDENDKMVAHAWIRAGAMYVTGGNGTGYAMVGKYRA